ncbi:MAG: EAL domain-containing protein [Alphaproteobacteria bacterium]|nr:EAL domain-containing protein [Alphaproteobacteria bacterium]
MSRRRAAMDSRFCGNDEDITSDFVQEPLMRVWEFGDNKETPADLVREQDFILRVRRMQRHGFPCLVLNFILSAIAPLAKDRKALEAAQKKLQAYAQDAKGAYYEMSNGDAFVVWENPGEARILSERAIEAALEEHKANANSFLLTYRMPENYAVLRERTNYYIEAARAAATLGGDKDTVDESIGHLTAKTVDQIEHLLGEIDIRGYGRTQTIYLDTNGKWDQVAEEYFISFEELRRERFPKLEVARSEHFFFAICTLLDQKLLTMLANSYDAIAGRKVNLNLSIASIMGSVFAQFVHRVPREQRNLIGFELHRGDLLQDMSLTLSAIDVLRREGFRTALDSITPNMVGYVNLDAFAVDRIKINVSKDRAQQLADPAIRKGLERLPSEKLIFFRCDNERALSIGREMGVKLFQGWLIDDMAGKKGT